MYQVIDFDGEVIRETPFAVDALKELYNNDSVEYILLDDRLVAEYSCGYTVTNFGQQEMTDGDIEAAILLGFSME